MNKISWIKYEKLAKIVNIIFIDKLWQIEQLENYSKKIIVSLKPNCSYILERKDIEYIDYSSLYNHEYEWKNYLNYNSNIETIVKNLGKYFLKQKITTNFLIGIYLMILVTLLKFGMIHYFFIQSFLDKLYQSINLMF